MIRLSVILVDYNTFSHTRECIQSIFQNKGIEIRVVLIDNSENENPEMRSLVEQYNLLYVKTATNVGFGKANNIGIAYALSETDPDYILLLNNDTVIEDDTLLKLVKAFELHEGIGLVTCRITYYHQPEKIWYGGATLSKFLRWPVIDDYNKSSNFKKSNQSREVDFISGCAMLFSRESIEKLRGFDEDFFMYVEDLELSIRAKKYGYRLWYTSETTIRHKIQASKQSGESVGLSPENPNLAFQFYNRMRNHWLTYRKHLQGIQYVFFYLIFRCFMRLKYVQLSLKTTKKKELAKAYLDVKNEIRTLSKSFR